MNIDQTIQQGVDAVNSAIDNMKYWQAMLLFGAIGILASVATCGYLSESIKPTSLAGMLFFCLVAIVCFVVTSKLSPTGGFLIRSFAVTFMTYVCVWETLAIIEPKDGFTQNFESVLSQTILTIFYIATLLYAYSGRMQMSGSESEEVRKLKVEKQELTDKLNEYETFQGDSTESKPDHVNA